MGRAYAEYDKREPQRLDADGYMEGDLVDVYSFGRWYLGRVTKVGRTLVQVRYRTRTGPERVKGFHAAWVRLLKSAKPLSIQGES
jgi:hypothetical protein